VEVEDGVVRVWRDWLGKVTGGGSTISAQGKEVLPTDQKRILWVDTARNVGLRVRVKETKWRREQQPILMFAGEEMPVSYEIEYEELLVRTSHLLLKFEKSLLQQDNTSGKAVVFGSFG